MKELKISNLDCPAIVDDEDYERLSKFTWSCAKGNGGSFRIRRQKRIRASRRLYPSGWQTEVISLANEVMQKYGCLFDHINRNPLYNSKSNLRESTSQQNCMNRSKAKYSSSNFKGVYWDSQKKRWRASITINKKIVHLGHYHGEHIAALAYDLRAQKAFGEFACLNIL